MAGPGVGAPGVGGPGVGGPDVDAARACFPQLRGSRRAYLDSAATSLKPQAVVDAVGGYLAHSVAGVHRGSHLAARVATDRFEDARRAVAALVGVTGSDLVVTASASAGFDLLARAGVGRAGRVWVTPFEHHSNLLPWLANGEVALLPCEPWGRVDLAAAERCGVREGDVVAVAHASNVTGLVQPVAELAAVARRLGATVVVDACQSVPHLPVDVADLGADFLVFSAHKAFGPEGVGLVAARPRAWTDLTPPSLGGGAIERMSIDGATKLRPVPHCFEYGTPNVAGLVGAAAGAGVLAEMRDAHAPRLASLRGELVEALAGLPRVAVVGGPDLAPTVPIVTVALEGADVATVASILSDRYEIDARAGFHCCHPLYETLGVDGGIRFSLQAYTSADEVARVVEAMTALATGRR